mmetsp:Transcript_212/g.724  ORF Transcript_212/g.724 Transcript_212/m.724 type:complete len:136 (-) Transcript_212:82-489(-)
MRESGGCSSLPATTKPAPPTTRASFTAARQVHSAAGGMGMVLQLSLAGEEEDAEGWTKKELSGYDGWGHDSSRKWNLAREADAFRAKWGAQAVTLQHRFYLHVDAQDNLWLSAEDGCEGYLAAAPPARPKVFGLF